MSCHDCMAFTIASLASATVNWDGFPLIAFMFIGTGI